VLRKREFISKSAVIGIEFFTIWHPKLKDYAVPVTVTSHWHGLDISPTAYLKAAHGKRNVT
jgi:hypothetical protein